MNLEVLFAKAKALGITEIESYEVTNDTTSIAVFDGKVEDTKTAMTVVTFYRGAYQGHLGSFYVENNNMSEDEILDRIIENAKIINENDPYIIYAGDKEYPKVIPNEADFADHSNHEKIALVLSLEREIRAQSPLVVATESVSYHERSYKYRIRNSLGLDVTKSGAIAYLVAGAVVERDGEVKTSFDINIGKKFNDLDYRKLAASIVSDAIQQLGGAPIKSGNYRTVIKNTVMNDLLEAYSSIFSALASIRKMSLLTGKEGTKVFGENINIYDDPLCPFALSQDAFDDEGVASYQKILVEKGIFKTFLHNLKTAKMLNAKSTANGYKDGVSSPVGVRPSNMYIPNGDKSLDELFALCGDGVYLTEITGLHAGINVVSGAFSLQSAGYVIRDGHLAEPISLIVTSGNFIELLNNVLAIGNNLDFKGGNIASPALLVKELAISGK